MVNKLRNMTLFIVYSHLYYSLHFWGVGHSLRNVTVHFFTTYLLWKFTFLTATEGSILDPRTFGFYWESSGKGSHGRIWHR